MISEEISHLLKEASHLGNHYQKNIQNIHRIFPDLFEGIKRYKNLEKISVLKKSKNYLQDLNKISGFSSDKKTILDFLGCYYSIQLLWFNISQLEWLDFQLLQEYPRWKVYEKFMLSSGLKFRRLTAAYIKHLLKVLREDKILPQFVLTGVGTRSDQDDIDVGIIDDGTGDRLWLNHVIDRMGVEMMRFASNFHFHLSEHVGTQVYSASIKEYQKLLEKRIGSFVILTEMLGAAYIIGDKDLFKVFQKQVTSRYYYHAKPDRYHEGYLRGIMGEIMDLVSRSVDSQHLHPKFDGLRIIKNLIYAYKVRFGIPEVSPWKILYHLKQKYPRFGKEFHILKTSLSFLEIFRYLYQQLVVQEEYIAISDLNILENLQKMAIRLHYRDFGPHRAVYQLLNDYKDAIQKVHAVIPLLLEDISKHLESISVFNSLFKESKAEGVKLDNFLKSLDFFYEVQYWDDLFTKFERSGSDTKERFLLELGRMNSFKRFEIFKSLSIWAGSHPDFIFKFCTIFKDSYKQKEIELINNLIGHYLSENSGDSNFARNLISLYRRDPSLLCQFLQICNAENLNNFRNIIFRKTLKGESALYQKNLAELSELILNCSYYFKRVISNVYHQFPEHACFIRDLEILNRESDKILNHLPFQKSIEARKRAIGNYYDLKFLQVGLDTFKGASVYQINHHYTKFVSIYFKELFGICLSEVVKYTNLADRLRKCISIYACGGNGREQAFDDDFDLIIIVHCEKKADRNIYREIMALMNTEMIRRGTLPHFRFTHHFGEYFCPYQELKALLNSEYAESYIDISQLLECRLLVGGQRLHQKFMNEIMAATIFAKADSYIEQMKREISQRHGSTTFFRTKCANIKECIGGLRDIEMIILIYKVYYKLIDINPYNLIQKFCIKDKNLSSCWKKIQTSLLFLQRFRYLYRLMITAEDNIYSHGLDRVAATFNPELPSHSNKSEWLWEQFLIHRKTAWQSLRQLLDFMTEGN